MADLEEKQIEVEGLLIKASSQELKDLAKVLKLEEAELADKSKLTVLKLIRKHIGENPTAETLEEVTTFLGKDPPALESMEEEKQQKMKALKKATEDFEKMQQDFEEIMKAKKEELEKAKLQLDKTKSEVGFSGEGKQDINIKGSENTSLGLQVRAEKTGLDLSKVFRKEFKIQGQVGLENQKDKIGFISLIRQIEAGVSKGYSEAEIVDGVIHCISPAVQLRRYLETLQQCTLPQLRKMLRSHFQEKSPTELFQQLATTVQEPKEEPQAFVIRCMELRQKILFGNKKADLGVEYNSKTVQTLFLHSIETGLTSETICTKMRPFLREGATDEQLIQEITVAASTENERQNKLNAANRVKQATVESIQPNETAAECKTKPQPKSGKMWAALEATQSELAAIKETVSTRPTTPPEFAKTKSGHSFQPKQAAVPWRQGCQDCQSKNVGATSQHCFICGDSSHIARGCRNRRQQRQENRSRLLLKGTQK